MTEQTEQLRADLEIAFQERRSPVRFGALANLLAPHLRDHLGRTRPEVRHLNDTTILDRALSAGYLELAFHEGPVGPEFAGALLYRTDGTVLVLTLAPVGLSYRTDVYRLDAPFVKVLRKAEAAPSDEKTASADLLPLGGGI